jgi:hypothetical protein
MVMAAHVPAAEQPEGEHEHGRRYHLNMAEVFAGGTYEDREHGGEDGFTIGFTYERRLNELLGVGGFYEFAAGEFDKAREVYEAAARSKGLSEPERNAFEARARRLQ